MKKYLFLITLLVTSGFASDLKNGLIFYAPLDGSTTPVKGAAGQEEKELKFVDGKFGKALRMEGSAKLVYLAKDAFSFDKGTLSLWFRRDLEWEDSRDWMIFKVSSVGNWNQNSFYITGTRWKELSVYNRVLTPEEVKALFEYVPETEVKP